MYRFNNIFIYKIFLTLLSLSIIFSSCTKEDEEIVAASSVYTGEWKCNDSESENGIYDSQSFTIDISENSNNYIIANFGNLGINTEVTAQILGSSITISEQTVDDMTIHGNGTFVNNNRNVNFTYFIDDEKIESVWNKN